MPNEARLLGLMLLYRLPSGSERGEMLKGVVDKKDSGNLEIVTSAVTTPTEL